MQEQEQQQQQSHVSTSSPQPPTILPSPRPGEGGKTDEVNKRQLAAVIPKVKELYFGDLIAAPNRVMKHDFGVLPAWRTNCSGFRVDGTDLKMSFTWGFV